MPKTEPRNPTALYCDDPSLTVQASKDECDINQIIARVMKGNDLTHVNDRVATYGDFSNVPSYQEALDFISRAQGMFMSMSPQVRERFHNNPGEMLAFLQNDANYDEAARLGLVVKKSAPAVAPGPITLPSGNVIPDLQNPTAPGVKVSASTIPGPEAAR